MSGSAARGPGDPLVMPAAPQQQQQQPMTPYQLKTALTAWHMRTPLQQQLLVPAASTQLGPSPSPLTFQTRPSTSTQ